MKTCKENGDCKSGEACANNFCWETCDEGKECSAEAKCSSDNIRDSDDRVCGRGCESLDDCKDGDSCDSGVCVPPGKLSLLRLITSSF